MSIRTINLSCQRKPTFWGKQGEDDATLLVADISSFLSAWPNGTPTVTIKRQDGRPYYKKDVEICGTNLHIPLKAVDVEIAGRMECTVNWTVGDDIAKSNTFFGFIIEDPNADSVPPTSKSILLLDQLETYVSQAQEAAKIVEELVVVEEEDLPYLTRVLTIAALPENGKPNKLYLATSSNCLYYWNDILGEYIPVSSGNAPSPTDDIIYGGNAYGNT